MPTRRSSGHEVPHGGFSRPLRRPDADRALGPLMPEEAAPSPFTPTAYARRVWGTLLLKVVRAYPQEETK